MPLQYSLIIWSSCLNWTRISAPCLPLAFSWDRAACQTYSLGGFQVFEISTSQRLAWSFVCKYQIFKIVCILSLCIRILIRNVMVLGPNPACVDLGWGRELGGGKKEMWMPFPLLSFVFMCAPPLPLSHSESKSTACKATNPNTKCLH